MDQQKSSVGGIIGTIIIISLIILGGLYFWGKRIEESKTKQELVGENNLTQQIELSEDASIKNVSSSDELDAIENDLNNTNLDNLGTEMNAEI